MKIGAFELLDPLGEGGMGTVWRGRHRSQGIDVAVKIMRAAVMDDPEYREAFETEVRSVASLDHPNIVTILDFGQISDAVGEATNDEVVGGCPYLVMEYGKGGAVDDYFYDIKWPDLRELLLVILDALGHAHARNVIHRDLKPENILVGCGPDWEVALTDFGLAHAADRFQDSGKVESAWGTPQYMAPEQLRGLWREYGPWTDLYALGCMAYEIICGQWPFTGDTVWEIGQAHIEEPIPALEPRFDIPSGTEAWVRQLLAKKRSERFQHTADAAYALAQLPALDADHGFGVLFEPPLDEKTRPDLPAGATTEVAATQVMPELKPTRSARSARLSGPDIAGGMGDGDKHPMLAPEVPPLPLNWRRRKEGAISNELLGISLGLFGLRSIPLVDREDERDWLWRILHDVHNQGRARQLVVEGAAGTGKSELVRWMCCRAREVGGARVLMAHHSPILGPADGLLPMMARFLRCTRLTKKKRTNHLLKLIVAEGLSADFDLRALEALFEGRGDSDDDTELISQQSDSGRGSGRQTGRQERYAIIYRFLALLARQRPIMVWLDDVQWGLDALGFANYVERRQAIEPAPILVAMTVRSEALAGRPTERRALSCLVDYDTVERCTLEPLEQQDIDRLVRHLLRLDEELAQHILQRSEGVPLFAVQLVEDWVARGKLVMGDQGFELRPGADIAIPDDLHELWDDRIRGFLGAQQKDVVPYLELAASLGQEVDSQEWRLAQQEALLPVVDGLVEQLVGEGLVRPMEGGWRFSHGMLQESLERRARESGRWQKWNACCARALTDLYDDDHEGLAERLAWYWLEAGERKRALQPLSAAIEEGIERSDFEHAEDLIDWREELTDDDSIDWKLKTEIDRARVCARRGQYQECADLAASATTMAYDANRSGQAARASLWTGVGRRALGELDDAHICLSAARDHFADGDRGLLAKSFLELGRVEEQRGDFELARRHFQKAREIFGDSDDLYGEALSLNALGDASRQSGDFDAAHRCCLEALERFRQIDNIAGIADCLNDLAELSRLQGDLEEAFEFAEESLRLYQALGSGEVHFVRLNMGMIRLEEEYFAIAAGIFSELLDSFQNRGELARSAEAQAGMLAADAGCGRWSGLEQALKKLKESFATTGARTPMATRALAITASLAQAAGQDEIAQRARKLAQQQIQSIRHAMSVEDPAQ